MTPSERHRRWEEVRDEELALVRQYDAAAQRDALAGLAISGGGIRSATFALGVLENLKALGVLPGFHYLSTVSGGGYIGAWLSANCRRTANWLRPSADWGPSIAHLRRYSNYLSPRLGFFSADTWSMFTIWIRNTMLIQATVILGLGCALLLPRPLAWVFEFWPRSGNARWTTILLFILGIVGIAGNHLRLTTQGGKVSLLRAKVWFVGLIGAVAAFAAAYAFARWVGFDPFEPGEVRYRYALPVAALLVAGGFLLQPTAVAFVAVLPGFRRNPPEQINYTQNWVQGVVIAPLMIAAFLVAAILWGEAAGSPGVKSLNALDTYGALFLGAWKYWPFPLSVVFVSFWMLSVCSVANRRQPRQLLVAVCAPIVAVVALHAMLAGIALLLRAWVAEGGPGAWKAFVWGPPIVALAFVQSIVVLIGMLSRESTDGVREWWSRLGAWLGIYATAWMVIAVSALYSPRLVDWALGTHPWTALGAGGGWIGTVAAGLFAGNSPATGGQAKTTSAQLKEVVAAVAPFVFIAGLLVAVSYVIHTIIQLNTGTLDWWTAGGATLNDVPGVRVSLAMLAALSSLLILMAWRIDINEFSLNAFYRNRLVRCYLGATRFDPMVHGRNPQNFTGFDDADDIALAELADGTPLGPLHLVNCALNLGGSSDLALHTRHSAAFTLSPLHCGTAYASRSQQGATEQLGYVPTTLYGDKGTPTLGQAISVSGAAASPNMGYHTSPVTAFLMTLFNVRLGWWFPHPDPRKHAAGRPSPRFNLTYLLAELFGGATDTSTFLMVSDGGHFENLAAYELFRRHCRVVVIVDGECDPLPTFEGLGTLVRMCEVDFGYRIDIDVDRIRPTADGWSERQFAVGTIDYRGEAPDGILIYVKASMTGGEETSVQQYKASHLTFPHETTGDQFYGEDQFESYRRLGRDASARVFAGTVAGGGILALAHTLLERERRQPAG